MDELLAAANHFIAENQPDVDQRWYPRFHLAPPVGWMNDPNGLTWFNGYFHAFYQHYPYAAEWGPMHWGHARSRDMIRWEHLPVALAPSDPQDKDGCFSGSAVVAGETLSLIYTGHKFDGRPVDENLYQVQCLATSQDGLTFRKEGQVLDTPAGVHHFRDPKVWREGDVWYMVVGIKVNDAGEIHIYRSDDLRQWQYESAIQGTDICDGYMWECPDLFRLGDKQVLMFSPQGINTDGYHYRNLFQSGCVVGEWQPGTPFTAQQAFHELDHGHDFYAPQSFTTPDGRRVIMGWLAMWESPMPEKADGWAGMLTLPRELTISATGKVSQMPVKEIETLRKEHHQWHPGEFCQQNVPLMEDAQALEVLLEWDVSRSTAERYGISLGTGARIFIDNQARRIVLERNYPALNLSGDRSVPLPDGECLSLRLFIDKSSLELFINVGEYTLSSRIYPEENDRQLSLFCHHGRAVVNKCCAWQLAS
ncbi:glycosyl hydrolase family 32 [Superficieibacter electus]|uniref:Sucrose-6-phosphate hydrolase n=1 Tax=Superficieibacter electus TaxID=2022662 RepID=A0A2P5GLG3_9ENTR|nr:glycoside hydrolase family 32 protein [Superficieibacter electus]POP42729.1 glycosyl hydrolase family 32 [Superficieibacter electus]POP45805.1 glycosyl hydrolase family 32 [Superficieibacter electus]